MEQLKDLSKSATDYINDEKPEKLKSDQISAEQLTEDILYLTQ